MCGFGGQPCGGTFAVSISSFQLDCHQCSYHPDCSTAICRCRSLSERRFPHITDIPLFFHRHRHFLAASICQTATTGQLVHHCQHSACANGVCHCICCCESESTSLKTTYFKTFHSFILFLWSKILSKSLVPVAVHPLRKIK